MNLRIEKIEVYEDGRGQFRYRLIDDEGGNQGESGDAFGSEEAAVEAAERRAAVETAGSDRELEIVSVTGEESRKAEAAIAEEQAKAARGEEADVAGASADNTG